MAMIRRGRLRQLWWTVHRWIGLGLMVVLIPIAVSGALLVYHDEFDALLNPKRWTVTGAEVADPSSHYLASASKVLATNEQLTGIRYPAGPGLPVRVLVRQQTDL